jgi:hypothetical protein
MVRSCWLAWLACGGSHGSHGSLVATRFFSMLFPLPSLLSPFSPLHFACAAVSVQARSQISSATLSVFTAHHSLFVHRPTIIIIPTRTIISPMLILLANNQCIFASPPTTTVLYSLHLQARKPQLGVRADDRLFGMRRYFHSARATPHVPQAYSSHAASWVLEPNGPLPDVAALAALSTRCLRRAHCEWGY